MGACVNTNSREFKEASKRLDISEGSLENIVHEFINIEGNEDSFPSDAYIKERTEGMPIISLGKNALELYNKAYKTPKTFDNINDLNAALVEAQKVFSPNNIGIRETRDGKYVMTVAKLDPRVVVDKKATAPVKTEYKGKLIYAPHKSGKTTIANNNDLVETNKILGDVMGTTAEAAPFVYVNLTAEQKEAVDNAFNEELSNALNSQKTVLTSDANLIEKADVVFEKASAGNRGNNTLARGEYLADKILTDPTYKVEQKNQSTDVLADAVSGFLQNFGIDVNYISEYSGNIGLFDALNRTINAKTANDITDGMGYAIAFMLQADPRVMPIVVKEAANTIPGLSALVNQKFIDKLATNPDKHDINLPIGVAKLVGRKNVTAAEIYAHFPGKKMVLERLGNEIADSIRKYYGRDERSITSKIWQSVKDFITKLIDPKFYRNKVAFIDQVTKAIITKDPSLIKGTDYRKATKGELQDISKAFKDNPYEENIIRILSGAGIALGGSAAIAREGSIFRPGNQPLHDIDFQAPKEVTTKEQLTQKLEGLFDHIKHARTIRDRKHRGSTTETYITMSVPFETKETDKENQVYDLFNSETKEKIGELWLKKQEVRDLKPGIQAKLLDFFLNSAYQNGEYSVTINGQQYLFSDAKNAFEAKIDWMRPKDIWDYKRYVEYHKVSEGNKVQYNTQSETESIKKDAISNGTFMLAPNGKPTNLSEQQWLQVRTKAFKEWFGDWENNPANASKVVDENGEPLVVYHGSREQFDEFSYEHAIGTDAGFFFTSDREYAKQFGTEVYPVFLNIKDPVYASTDQYDIPLHRTNVSSIFYSFINTYESNRTAEELNKLDGIIGHDSVDEKLNRSNGEEYMTLRPNQVKSATGNSGEFSSSTDNIYQNRGTESTIAEWLRDLGFIHKYDPSSNMEGRNWYISKEGMFVSIPLRKQEIRTALRINGIPQEAVRFEETDGNAVRVIFSDVQEIDAITRNSEVGVANVQQVVEFLKQRFPKLKGKVHYVTNKEASEALGKTLPRNVRSFVKNGNVYLIKSRLNEDIAIEECLHPFTYTLFRDNPMLYNSLLQEAMKQFPQLKKDIMYNYRSKEGFTVDDRGLELVTQALARHFREEFNNNEANKVTDSIFGRLANQFMDFIRKALYVINFSSRNNKVLIAPKQINPKLKLSELAKLINTSDTEFLTSMQEGTQYNREEARDDISDIYPEGRRIQDIGPSDRAFVHEHIYINGKRVAQEEVEAFNRILNGEEEISIDEVRQAVSKMPSSYDATYVIHDMLEYLDDNKEVVDPYDYAFEVLAARGNELAKVIIEAMSSDAGSEFSDLFSDYNSLGELVEALNFDGHLDNVEIYYQDDRQMSLFEDESPVNEDGLSKPMQEQVRPELQGFQNRTQRVINQVMNLRNSMDFTNTEIREVGTQVADFISQTIDEFLSDPESIFEVFPELANDNEGNSLLNIDEDTSLTEEQKADRRQAYQDKLNEIREMSRVDLIKFITPGGLVNLIKERLFNPENNENIDSSELVEKAKAITDNFEAIMWFAKDAILQNEHFQIVSTDEVYTVQDKIDGETDNESVNRENEVINTELGNSQEAWQVDSRTRDFIDAMDDEVKTAIRRCIDKHIDPETGEIEEEITEFGLPKRASLERRSETLGNWLSGTTKLSTMIQILESKAKDNLWVNDLLERLKDDSGNETTLQANFVGVFSRITQPYSVVTRERQKDGTQIYKSMIVNEQPALKEAINEIKVSYQANTNPMFTPQGVNKTSLETLKAINNDLISLSEKPLAENDKAQIISLVTKGLATLGYTLPVDVIDSAIDSDAIFKSISTNFNNIVTNLDAVVTANRQDYNPFDIKDSNGIVGYLRNLLTPLTTELENTMINTVIDNGKMYQSKVIPSYLSTFISKFATLEGQEYINFIQEEFGQYEYFRDLDGDWRGAWLKELAEAPLEDRKKLLNHRVQLNFNKHNYMKGMPDNEYALSVLTEYFANAATSKGYRFIANYRVPMQSNKPSSEFVSFYAYSGEMMEPMLLNGFYDVFLQELTRIQTVEIRNFDKKSPNAIKSFDTNGKKFIFLDFLNKQYNDAKAGKADATELGKLINKAIKEGTEFSAETGKGLTTEENARMQTLAKEAIKVAIDARAQATIEELKANGAFEGAKQISGIGKSDEIVTTKLREFVWNDTLAAMNFLQLTITDIAFYKDAEDLQKRLAQLHAPGIRPHVDATDFEGNKVSDGKFRTILLKDFDSFISNIKDNLRITFDRKLSELERKGVDKDSREYKSAKALYDNIIDSYDAVNVADAQGYSSPTSYRKKAFLFGKWNRHYEEVYQRLLNNDYTFNDLKTAFQPLKPFVYGQIGRAAMPGEYSSISTPMSKLKIPVQFKNSEYLLIMADAILRNENTGKPNLLRAIYDVMEESARRFNTMGIDTVQFESTCKSGLQAPIDINQFYNDPNGEFNAKYLLNSCIYENYVRTEEQKEANPNEALRYNTNVYVYEVPFENYAIQQEVPAHFKNHEQPMGSQGRYIITSDLETVNSEGEAVTYNFNDNGVEKKLTAEEFKREFEETAAANIEESIQELSAELGLNNSFLSRKDRNVALSKILVKEIFDSPRYGIDLAIACTVDETTGEFRVPLGDPIQAKRIEQLINSIIKNRINKQEVAGGPVVQVSNYGVSRELNIRYQNAKGELLMTRQEFEEKAKNHKEGTVPSYEDYLRENQKGVAYYEVYCAMPTDDVFMKFANKDGMIDIEAVERVAPDLLKMIGYRIPTEDKYSMAPLKIVGFLPREAGEGIMLPAEITTITGSDFDIDKFYLMRKEVDIATRDLGVLDSERENNPSYTKTAKRNILKAIKDRVDVSKLNVKLTDKEVQTITDKTNNHYETLLWVEQNKHNERIQSINTKEEKAKESARNSNLSEDKLNKRLDTLTEKYNSEKDSENSRYNSRIDKINKEKSNTLNKALERAESRKIDDTILDFLGDRIPGVESPGEVFSDVAKKSGVYNEIRNAYLDYMYHQISPATGRVYRNNKMVDMMWAVLTNETTADKMLTPGGFEAEKTMGYMISAYKNPANAQYKWTDLVALANKTKALLDNKLVDYDKSNKDMVTGVDALKQLCYTEKNLCFFDTHLQFYKQNAAAATALGMAAVQKVAHAVLSGDNIMLDVNSICDLKDGKFTIAGTQFSGFMPLDSKYDSNGKLQGMTLAEFVAMFADAVKDPVANLMNINNTTMPIVTTLIRLGMPFNTIATFISQPIITRLLQEYNKANLTGYSSLSTSIRDMMNTLKESSAFTEESNAESINELSLNVLVNGLRFGNSEGFTGTNYVILKAFDNISKIANKVKGPTFVTRHNSISSAVGPQIIDNIILENKVNADSFKHIYMYDESGNFIPLTEQMLYAKHPILDRFHQAVDIANEVFRGMPLNSMHFRQVIENAMKAIVLKDRKLLSQLGDFYQSYLLVSSGVVPTSMGQTYQPVNWGRTATNNYEVSTAGTEKSRRFSAFNAKFSDGTVIDGVDVSNKSIEWVYQNVIKKSGKGQPPAQNSRLYNPNLKTKEEMEDFSYENGYLPLWKMWAKQNPELMDELRRDSQGRVLTDKFATGKVSQARALADILNSGIKREGLKYYIDQFPADFVKYKVKERYAGNALIDAIRLESKDNKLSLKVDIAGLQRETKDKLSDAWYELYRDYGEKGKKLALHLFYYNFFKAGIGFSPKSFMSLFPVSLRDKVPGYNDVFAVHSLNYGKNAVPAEIMTQFVQNNTSSNKLVPQFRVDEKKGLVYVYNDQRKSYTFRERAFEKIKDSPFIKIKVGKEFKLLMKVFQTKPTSNNKFATFTEIPILGNNGEYIEINPGNSLNYAANLDHSVRTEIAYMENSQEEAYEDTEQTNQTDDARSIEEESDYLPPETVGSRADEYYNALVSAFEGTNQVNNREEAEQQIRRYQEFSEEKKKSLEKGVKSFLKKKFEELGLKYNEEDVDEIYKILC